MLLPCTSIDAHTHTHALITSLSDMTAHHRSVQHDLNIKTDQKVCISLRELCINVRTTTAESSSVTQQPNQRSRHKGLGTKLLQGFLESFITETTDAGSEVHLTTLPQFRNSLRGTKVRQASNPHVIPYHCLAIFLSLYHTFTPSEPKAFPLPLTNVLRSVLPQHGSVNHVHVHITPSTKMRDKRLTCNPKEEHQITKRGERKQLGPVHRRLYVARSSTRPSYNNHHLQLNFTPTQTHTHFLPSTRVNRKYIKRPHHFPSILLLCLC
jgi:hypothetical protein